MIIVGIVRNKIYLHLFRKVILNMFKNKYYQIKITDGFMKYK